MNLKCPNTPGERGGREASETEKRERERERLKMRCVSETRDDTGNESKPQKGECSMRAPLQSILAQPEL